MYFLIKDDRKAHFNAWKYPIFFFSFFETFRGRPSAPQFPPPMAPPLIYRYLWGDLMGKKIITTNFWGSPFRSKKNCQGPLFAMKIMGQSHRPTQAHVTGRGYLGCCRGSPLAAFQCLPVLCAHVKLFFTWISIFYLAKCFKNNIMFQNIICCLSLSLTVNSSPSSSPNIWI